jgi:hypothetical protein
LVLLVLVRQPLPISLEVMNDDLLALPPREAALRIARSMRPAQ